MRSQKCPLNRGSTVFVFEHVLFDLHLWHCLFGISERKLVIGYFNVNSKRYVV